MSMHCVHWFHDNSGPKDVTSLRNANEKDVYFCKTCGTDVPRTLKHRLPVDGEEKKFETYQYLNPHAILHFSNEGDSELCPQCLYFSNLEVDTIDDGSQTANQFKLILLGIFMSPAIWIALLVAMPISQNAFRTMSIIAVVCTQNVYNI